jgi:nicotinamide-nucleotide amidase
MKACILSVGDELVLGQTVDTNSAWLSQQLASIGVSIVAHHTVGDVQADIESSIDAASKIADIILISGGIGPTDDDLTRQALASVLKQPLELDSKWLEHLKAFFTKLGRVMPESNQIQAMIPRGATMIWNHNGTAAGLDATIEHRYDRTRPPRQVRVFVMPGVPKEMKPMFTQSVLPHLSGGGGVILQKTIHTFGAGESSIAEKLGDLMKRGRNPSVGTTVAGGIVSVRINSRFDDKSQAQTEIETSASAVRAALGDLIFGEDSQTLAGVVSAMLRRGSVKDEQMTLATAESCTGGLLAKYLTDEAGASIYYCNGWVTYANDFKTRELEVDPHLFETVGAVSEEVARAMALGARQAAGSDYALSSTGIAGPDGGTEQKPVGTVWIGLSSAAGENARKFLFPGDREMIRDRAAKMALTMLRFALLGKPLPF